jgi:hypothetical protein
MLAGSGLWYFFPSFLNSISVACLASAASLLGHCRIWLSVSIWHLHPGHLLIPVMWPLISFVGNHPHILLDDWRNCASRILFLTRLIDVEYTHRQSGCCARVRPQCCHHHHYTLGPERISQRCSQRGMDVRRLRHRRLTSASSATVCCSNATASANSTVICSRSAVTSISLCVVRYRNTVIPAS